MISKLKITPANLNDYLGVKLFSHGVVEKKDMVGQVNGLAWTSVGGENFFVLNVHLCQEKGRLSRPAV